MKELLKKILNNIKEEFHYLDEQGKKITSTDAAKKGIRVQFISTKVEAKKSLKEIGLDIDDDDLVSDLRSVLDKLRNENFSGIKLKKMSYSNGYKLDMVNKYKNLKGKITQIDFAKKNGITPVTFISWITNYDQIKLKHKEEIKKNKM